MTTGKIEALLFTFVVALFVTRYVITKFKKSPATDQVGGLSAFAKIADAEVKKKEAEGKVIAAKAAAEAKKAEAAVLKQGALEAHAAIDEAHKDFDEVHEILG